MAAQEYSDNYYNNNNSRRYGGQASSNKKGKPNGQRNEKQNGKGYGKGYGRGNGESKGYRPHSSYNFQNLNNAYSQSDYNNIRKNNAKERRRANKDLVDVSMTNAGLPFQYRQYKDRKMVKNANKALANLKNDKKDESNADSNGDSNGDSKDDSKDSKKEEIEFTSKMVSLLQLMDKKLNKKWDKLLEQQNGKKTHRKGIKMSKWYICYWLTFEFDHINRKECDKLFFKTLKNTLQSNDVSKRVECANEVIKPLWDKKGGKHWRTNAMDNESHVLDILQTIQPILDTY